MTAVKVQIIGREELARRLEAIDRRSRPAVRQAIAASALEVEREAKRSILENPRRGRFYVRYNPTRTGRASAPGDPPANDLGHLVRNITHVIDADGLGASVESRAFYSHFLEYGTVKMAARPFMFRALEKHKARIAKRIAEAVRRAAARVTGPPPTFLRPPKRASRRREATGRRRTATAD
ncbi:MAG: HK97-gp10 family putative phage morphogenesis protein [Kiloniellales bacterium]